MRATSCDAVIVDGGRVDLSTARNANAMCCTLGHPTKPCTVKAQMVVDGTRHLHAELSTTRRPGSAVNGRAQACSKDIVPSIHSERVMDPDTKSKAVPQHREGRL
jgi:hypothetical protein